MHFVAKFRPRPASATAAATAAVHSNTGYIYTATLPAVLFRQACFHFPREAVDRATINAIVRLNTGANSRDDSDSDICRAIIGVAQSLGLNVVAEGVETEAQRDFLLSLGTTQCQGYLYSRPVPPAEFAIGLRRGGAGHSD